MKSKPTIESANLLSRALAEAARPKGSYQFLYGYVGVDGQFLTIGKKVKIYKKVPKAPIQGFKRAKFELNREADPKIWVIVDANGEPYVPVATGIYDLPAFDSEVNAITFYDKLTGQGEIFKEPVPWYARHSHGDKAIDLQASLSIVSYGLVEYVDTEAKPLAKLNPHGVALFNWRKDTLYRVANDWWQVPPSVKRIAAPFLNSVDVLYSMSPKQQTEYYHTLQATLKRSSAHERRYLDEPVKVSKNVRDQQLARKYGYEATPEGYESPEE